MYFRAAKHPIISFAIILSMLAPTVTFAAPMFTANPLVIDGKGHPRDIMKFSLTVKNTEPHLISIYPWVTNFSSASGTEIMPDLGKADLSRSLANWIEITRGAIDLLPGESRDIPIMIQINLNAKPGVYHAYIDLSTGGSRLEAESNRSATLSVPVNIEVMDDANEKLQLRSFVPDKNWFLKSTASFRYSLENIGNRGLLPRGQIHIYDRKGEEVATIDANHNGERLEPSADAMLSAVWSSGDNFGKYKAMLDLEYGEVGRGTVQDTIFFWVIPWQKLLGMFLSIIVAAIIIAVMAHSRTQAKPAYARSRYYHDEDATEDEAEEVTLVTPEEKNIEVNTIPTRITERFKKNAETLVLENVVDEQSSQYMLPKRAIYESVVLEQRSTESPSHDILSGNQVKLASRQAPETPPEHIINLRR